VIVEWTIIPIFMSWYIVNCLACRTKFKVIRILIFTIQQISGFLVRNIWPSRYYVYLCLYVNTVIYQRVINVENQVLISQNKLLMLVLKNSSRSACSLYHPYWYSCTGLFKVRTLSVFIVACFSLLSWSTVYFCVWNRCVIDTDTFHS
jgi:hypothetical protein